MVIFYINFYVNVKFGFDIYSFISLFWQLYKINYINILIWFVKQKSTGSGVEVCGEVVMWVCKEK